MDFTTFHRQWFLKPYANAKTQKNLICEPLGNADFKQIWALSLSFGVTQIFHHKNSDDLVIVYRKEERYFDIHSDVDFITLLFSLKCQFYVQKQ